MMMKKINWKVIMITCITCLLPMILGIIFYNDLPSEMAVHFNIHNEPDNYASKNFALFGIPLFLMLLQAFCCIVNDINKHPNDEHRLKFIIFFKWIIPVTSIVVYSILILQSLGREIDIRKIVCILIGFIFIITGNYMPKMSYESAKGRMRPLPKDETKYKKLVFVYGYCFVICGFLMLLSILFEPIYSAIVIGLLLLASVIASIYCAIN